MNEILFESILDQMSHPKDDFMPALCVEDNDASSVSSLEIDADLLAAVDSCEVDLSDGPGHRTACAFCMRSFSDTVKRYSNGSMCCKTCGNIGYQSRPIAFKDHWTLFKKLRASADHWNF